MPGGMQTRSSSCAALRRDRSLDACMAAPHRALRPAIQPGALVVPTPQAGAPSRIVVVELLQHLLHVVKLLLDLLDDGLELRQAFGF